MPEDGFNLGLRFQQIAQATPEASAIVLEQRSYDFGSVNAAANRIARWLLAHGLRSTNVACLQLPKSIEAYALAIACIKIGVPYAFIDPDAPPERVRLTLERCNPAIVFSTHEGAGVRIVLGSALQREKFSRLTLEFDASNLRETAQITGADPAYIMFTSGSTGEPKGVVIPHQGVLSLVDWASRVLRIGPEDRLTNVNPLHFDNSVFDIYCGLLNGASIVPLEALKCLPPAALVNRIAETKCTFFFAVPTLFMYLDSLHLLTPDSLPSVTRFMFGGEGFPIPRLRRFYNSFRGRAQLINCYGPTETSCICSSFEITEPIFEANESLAPLGRLNPNFCYRVLDDELNPVTAGAIGEMWLGGPCVGLGYINNPEETARRFRQDPLIGGYRSVLYRTGDLVQEDPQTGVLRFRGRADNQVKLRGHRVELEEIDHALEAIPGVDRALAVAIHGSGGAVRLIAAYSGRKLDTSELFAHCRDRLPSYMTPTRFAWLEALPVNANGKADRRAIAALVAEDRLSPLPI